MGKQFPPTSGGMGRKESGHTLRYDGFAAGRHISLFKVTLDRGGYDDGGAYWGVTEGRALYCAVSREQDYIQFIRAKNRVDACLRLHIPQEHLLFPLGIIKWGRYSAQKGWFGKAEPGYEIKEFGQILHHVDNWKELCRFADKMEKQNG